MSELLEPVLVLEAVLLALVVLGTLGHAAWRAIQRRRLRPRIEAARDAIVETLSPVLPPQARERALAAVGRLPARLRLGLLAGVGDQVTGDAGRRVAELTVAAGLDGQLARNASARSRRRRLGAARALTATGGGADVVPALLDDPDPRIRAQAAMWVVRHGDEDAIRRLVAHAFDEDGLSRFASADAIVRIGPRAAPALAAALTDDRGAELVVPLRVAGHVRDVRLLEPVRALCASALPAVRAQALDSLARIGGLAEAPVLEAALHDPDPAVRAAAVGGLGRVGAWRATPAIGAALRDPAWDVRRAAGLALLALDAPGRLVLRRALQDEDRFAADMARLALDEERVA